MNTLLKIIQVLGVVVQKAVNLHKSGADTEFLNGVLDIAHEIHETIHPHHAEMCPDECAKMPHPEELKNET